MRKLTLLLVLAGLAMMAFAQEVARSQSFKRITVEQLEQLLAGAHGKPDAEVAQELSGLELTERLSTIRLLHWNGQLPGGKSERALAALADESAFLDLPPAEIPTIAVPDLEAQRRITTLTADYVTKAIHQFPNFLATRVTTSFQDEPRQPDKVQAESFPLRLIGDQPLKFVARDHVTVLYGDGWEVQSKAAQSEPDSRGLTDSVRFGPILGTAIPDAAPSKLAWSHWEPGSAGPEAVFSYTVPSENSHLRVEYCCVYGKNGNNLVRFPGFSPYQGQITVDPSTGAILRLLMRIDPGPNDPFVKAAIVVEYGPVKIGDRTYICPVKSIALSLGLPFRRTGADNGGLLQTSLNDVVFEKYQLFKPDPSRQTYNWSWTQAIPGP